MRDLAVGWIGTHRLLAERPHFPARVLPLERGEIHHADNQLQTPHLRFLLQRPLRQRRRALLGCDRVDSMRHLQCVAEAAAEDGRSEDGGGSDERLAHKGDNVSTPARPAGGGWRVAGGERLLSPTRYPPPAGRAVRG